MVSGDPWERVVHPQRGQTHRLRTTAFEMSVMANKECHKDIHMYKQGTLEGCGRAQGRTPPACSSSSRPWVYSPAQNGCVEERRGRRAGRGKGYTHKALLYSPGE